MTVEGGADLATIERTVVWSGDPGRLEVATRRLLDQYGRGALEAGRGSRLDVSDVDAHVGQRVERGAWTLRLTSSTLSEAQLAWLVTELVVTYLRDEGPPGAPVPFGGPAPDAAGPSTPHNGPPPGGIPGKHPSSHPPTGQVPGSTRRTSSGWYYAQGDPSGTVRYWNGTRWLGGAVSSGAAAPTVATDPIDRRVGSLEDGRVAFNPPTSMKVGQRERFVVRIVRNTAFDRQLVADLDRPSDLVLSSLQTSFRMKVTCAATDGLRLQALSEQTQIVATNNSTQWEYGLEAIDHGKEVIWVTATAILGQVPGPADSVISLPVLHHPVEVTITPTDRAAMFAKDHWKWLVATGLTVSGGIATWIGVLS